MEIPQYVLLYNNFLLEHIKQPETRNSFCDCFFLGVGSDKMGGY